MDNLVDKPVDEQELTGGEHHRRRPDRGHGAPRGGTLDRIAPLSGDALAGAGYDDGRLDPMARPDALTAAYISQPGRPDGETNI